MAKMMWTYLLHLGTNMWADKDGEQESPWECTMRYHDELCCDKRVWDDVLAFLPAQGINTVVIDLADGVRYESHPELAIRDSWTGAQLRCELQKIRQLGMTPVPKLNFSAAHSAWLKQYGRMLSTDAYYRVCEDLIDEVCRLFDGPGLFHLGMDEETAEHQRTHSLVSVRGEKLWWGDLYRLFERCGRNGARPWVWSDYYWRHPEAFAAQMPKDVLQSNWYYGFIDTAPPRGTEERRYIDAYFALERLGYEQVPTGSTFNCRENLGDTVRMGRERLNPALLRGYMAAPWMMTHRHNYHGLLQEAVRLGVAKARYYPGEE